MNLFSKPARPGGPGRYPMARVALAIATIAATTSLLLAGCGAKDESELIASAKAFIEKKDSKAAAIQLKNALQINGDSGEARLLLGQVLLAQGDSVSAVVELGKARTLKVADDRVVPDLARALLLSGEDSKLIAQFASVTLGDATARAKLATELARAYLLRGDTAKTRTYIDAALAAVPTHAQAITLNAQLLADAGDTAGAQAVLDTLLQREPGQLDAGLFKGALLRATGNAEAALTEFKAVLAKNPDVVPAHSSVISTQLALGQKDAATQSLQALQKLAAGHPDTLFFEAQLAYDAGKLDEARDLSGRVLKMVPGSVRALELAAAIEFRRANYTQAELFLTNALNLSPGQVLSRHMLAETHLRLGQADRALEVLKPLLEVEKVQPSTLALAAETYLLQGDYNRAEEAFTRATRLAPEDVRLRTSLAMSQLARTRGGSDAVQALEKLSLEDRSPRADLALVSARLSQKDLAGALKALEGLQTKQPDRALAYHLRSQIQVLQGDRNAARASLETALQKEPKFLPAGISLAALDIEAGKRDAARERIRNMVKLDPGNAAAHLALAEVSLRTGAVAAEVIQLLNDAVRANPNEPRTHVALVTHLLASGETRNALTAAQAGAAALPGNAAVQDALGRALLANGDPQQALSTWRALASQQPRQPLHQLRLAEVQATQQAWDDAERSLKRALEIQPGLLQAERALVALAIQRGKPENGLPTARELQKRLPKNALGWLLEGDIELARKNTAAAQAAYRTAVQREGATEAAIRLHRSLVTAGQTAEATSFAQQWQKAQPKDGVFHYYLGDAALAQRDLAAAESHYRAVLQVVPDNAMAMNNIAWILASQGKPGGVALATKANELSPGQAAVLDTLALAQAAEGQMKEAVETQKRAIALAPNDPALKLSLARVYLKSGEKAFARAELEDLAKLGDKFADQAQVKDLLQQVR